jgi:hypothetical protein
MQEVQEMAEDPRIAPLFERAPEGTESAGKHKEAHKDKGA